MNTTTPAAISAAPAQLTQVVRNLGIARIEEMSGGHINIININVASGESIEWLAERVALILKGRSHG